MTIKSSENKASKENYFPYSQFPIKVIHKDGKDLKDTKVCYFQSQDHANKYIQRSKFNKKDYQIFSKEGTVSKKPTKRKTKTT